MSALPRPRLHLGDGAPAPRWRSRATLALASLHVSVTRGNLRMPVLKALDVLLPARSLPAVTAELAPGVAIELDPGGAMARASLIAAGYEHREVEVLARATGPGGVFLDVGANIGWFTLMLAVHRPRAQVWAFEPLPGTADRLADNVRRARCANVRVIRAAAGRATGSARFVLTGDDAFAHRLHGPESAPGRAPVHTCEVTTVDEQWHRAGAPRVDAMKVDVEGAETDVLAGAEEVLRRDRPLLMVETPTAESAAAVREAVAPHGYRGLAVPGVLPYNTFFAAAGGAA
ncbi:FkbM family methyltransferase [Lentzea sp. NPDC060358]|uniref:FkbM family methyltransferase n=1 Tax=Lentzea sp. NPDC060358 TaxID=3347103 RepID=UPI0036466E7C